MNRCIPLILLSSILSACATTPAPLQGQFEALTAKDAAGGSHSGARVRWGGTIITVQPAATETCFEVLAHAVDAQSRPRIRDASEGRFMACRSGFYDPEVFSKGRELTIAGTLDGTRMGRIGQFDYTYPKVAAETIFLWPPRPLVIERRDYWPYDPFWGPAYGPHWRVGYWGPFW